MYKVYLGVNFIDEEIDTQSVIERIKTIKDVHSDKDVAALLCLTPADFSSKKKGVPWFR